MARLGESRVTERSPNFKEFNDKRPILLPEKSAARKPGKLFGRYKRSG
jgi:hypothetical protein